MRPSSSLAGLCLAAGSVAAIPRAWVVENTASEPSVVGGIPIPHHKRQIIEGPGGYTFNVLEHMAGIAPYFDSPGVQLDPSPPDGCTVDKATYLVRHSNIYANDFDYETYLSPFLSKLANYTNRDVFTQTPDLAFLANYTSPITNETEQIEKVTPSGLDAAAAFAGVIKELYPNLLNISLSESGAFRVWAASASRDVDTANSFIGALGNNASLVTVNEGENDSADSLTPHSSCPVFDSAMGSVQSGAWVQKYTAPLITRFNNAAPEFNFTLTDIVGMQQLCGYDNVIRNQTDFCNIFTAEEWLDFEYANDLMYFYSIGFGNMIAPQLGMPWVRSALNILSANDTSTFNQTLYVSFSHREEPPLIMTALKLFNNSAYYPALDVNSTMPTDRINYDRAWKTSQILPFLGHVGIERLQCANTTVNSTQSDDGAETISDVGSFVRVLVNGAPIPIPDCQDGPGQACALGKFSDYIQGRVALYGDFIGACGINDTVTNRTDTLSIYNASVAHA
ncbi:phosphoglycerate mutase-like protein [Epithele typhae]|uniref:phosphoglycerate mutase-like protein n=1 Tax=Epithele typhae TaxID=378194 RepID=UPI002007FA2D|nr:phosphoglycerate mutase-like protein [Epithele typhae]KAH9940793.1 phosphoglycerate mutase-like protein [Epithele typhae]